jgi:hypothetical protein
MTFPYVCRRIALRAAAVMVIVTPTSAYAQSKPFTLSDVEILVRGGVSSEKILSRVSGSCISFKITPESASTLRSAGADDKLLAGLLSVCYKEIERVVGPKPLPKVTRPIVRRDTASPSVVRRDPTQPAMIVPTPVTPRKDRAGYGPYNWGMSIAEVRNIAATHGMDADNSGWDERFGSVTLTSGDALPDEDLLRQYFQCGQPRPVHVLFSFSNGLLTSVAIGVDENCPQLNELATKLVSRYSMTRRWPDQTTWFARNFYQATEEAREITLSRGSASVEGGGDLLLEITKKS